MMLHFTPRDWQFTSVGVGLAVAGAAALWWFNRRRPTPDDLEQERRHTLVNYGRIVDGMLLDGFDVTGWDASSRRMLLYQYEISGVSYECSQDITLLRPILDPAEIKIGMPCSIRYQPGSPENSILVAEGWSGLRNAVPISWLPQPGPARTGDTASSRAHLGQLTALG